QVNDRRDLFALVHDFGDSAGKPQVPDVAYFLYVDSARVRDMYSQIEPEWLEKQRIVTHSHTRTAKASVTGGAVAAEVGGSADAQEQSTEEPPAASPERECQGLMKYAVDRKGAKSYTTDDAWGITQILPELSKPTFQVPPETKFSNGLPLNWAEIRQLTASEPIFDNSPDATRAINEELSQSSANWESRLKGELTQPPDLIFVHGAFRISTTGSLLLSHDFVLQDGAIHLYKANFGPVLFSVTFPPGTHDREFDGKHEVNATVFGKVVHGLDDQGVIELRALAVY
ncbi:MAG TPA: hypothetical protein VJN48_14025, partial [Terriglobales bacterium]|nr:hypothetical protein [Terriglobales bacterium]